MVSPVFMVAEHLLQKASANAGKLEKTK